MTTTTHEQRSTFTCVQCGQLWHARVGSPYVNRCVTCRTRGWRRARDEYQACGHWRSFVAGESMRERLTIKSVSCLDCEASWKEISTC